MTSEDDIVTLHAALQGVSAVQVHTSPLEQQEQALQEDSKVAEVRGPRQEKYGKHFGIEIERTEEARKQEGVPWNIFAWSQRLLLRASVQQQKMFGLI
jgi:hypothetical protein